MILTTYQQREALREEQGQHSFIATVEDVNSSGMAVLFPGETASGAKRYRYNKAVSFQKGDRVYMMPMNGTYVAAFPLA